MFGALGVCFPVFFCREPIWFGKHHGPKVRTIRCGVLVIRHSTMTQDRAIIGKSRVPRPMGCTSLILPLKAAGRFVSQFSNLEELTLQGKNPHHLERLPIVLRYEFLTRFYGCGHRSPVTYRNLASSRAARYRRNTRSPISVYGHRGGLPIRTTSVLENVYQGLLTLLGRRITSATSPTYKILRTYHQPPRKEIPRISRLPPSEKTIKEAAPRGQEGANTPLTSLFDRSHPHW